MIDLDVSDPMQAVRAIEKAAQVFGESAGELAHYHQDKNAGKVWSDFAQILDRAATQMQAAVKKRIG